MVYTPPVNFFQKIILLRISDIHGGRNSQDDIVVWRKTLAEHGNRFRKALLKVIESGLKLNSAF